MALGCVAYAALVVFTLSIHQLLIHEYICSASDKHDLWRHYHLIMQISEYFIPNLYCILYSNLYACYMNRFYNSTFKIYNRVLLSTFIYIYC